MLSKVTLACLAISLMVTSNMYSDAASTNATVATKISSSAGVPTNGPVATKISSSAGVPTNGPVATKISSSAGVPTNGPVATKISSSAGVPTNGPVATKISSSAGVPTNGPVATKISSSAGVPTNGPVATKISSSAGVPTNGPVATKISSSAGVPTNGPVATKISSSAGVPTNGPVATKISSSAGVPTNGPVATKISSSAGVPTNGPVATKISLSAGVPTNGPVATKISSSAGVPTNGPVATKISSSAGVPTNGPVATKISSSAGVPTNGPVATKISSSAGASKKASVPTTKISSTSVPMPNKFSYSCDSNGDLTVNKKELNSYELKVLQPSNISCKLENNKTAYKINGCGKNTPILVLLEAKHAMRITGGRSREFQLYCHDSTEPYVVNVTLSPVIITEPTKYTVLSTVSPSKSTIQPTMNIYEKETDTKVTNAVIGQEMTLKIKYSGLHAVHPIECYATHGNNSYMFWSEAGCEADKTLVGHKWEKKNSSVSIALYAFHFEQSHDVGIRCSVRVCPQGYTGTLCNLDCGTSASGKRRRRAAMAKDIQTYDVRTNMHVVDVESAIASAKGLTVNTFSVFVFAIFVKLF